MSRYVFVDADSHRSPLNLKVGDELVLFRQMTFGGRSFHRAKLPAQFSPAGGWDHKTSLPNQPAGSYIVDISMARTAGSGNITLEFKAMYPNAPVDPPETISYTIS